MNSFVDQVDKYEFPIQSSADDNESHAKSSGLLTSI